jgi:hypothetical protein
MGWFVILLGIFWIIIGIFGILATKRINLALSNLIKNTPQKNLGLTSLIIGVLLLLAAVSVRESWFVFMLGIIACLKGLTIVLMPAKGLKAIMDWWLAAPEIVHKGWAIAVLILGVVVFYIV